MINKVFTSNINVYLNLCTFVIISANGTSNAKCAWLAIPTNALSSHCKHSLISLILMNKSFNFHQIHSYLFIIIYIPNIIVHKWILTTLVSHTNMLWVHGWKVSEFRKYMAIVFTLEITQNTQVRWKSILVNFKGYFAILEKKK